MTIPVLYSFRRCPYAMRARLAVYVSGIEVQLREVVLKNKPPELIACSPKSTVPVLQLENSQVIDESVDIMMWALNQSDPENWLCVTDDTKKSLIQPWIARNDHEFKPWLDRYKYADRYPEHDAVYYRQRGEEFLQSLEALLQQHRYCLGDQLSMVDMAVFPFVRQFAHVDLAWFDQSKYAALQQWLNELLNSDIFSAVMNKYPAWQDGNDPVIFGGAS